MNTIKVRDITNSTRAISAIEGALVFEQLDAYLTKNERVALDFEGIELTITAFLNSSVGKLYSKYKSEQIRELVEIKNLHQEEVHLLRLVVERAKERFSKPYSSDSDEIDLVNEI